MLQPDSWRAQGGWRCNIPGAVSSLPACMSRTAEGLGLLKVDRGQDSSHQHLGSEWPLMLGGVFDGPGHEGMLLAPLPAQKAPEVVVCGASCCRALWNGIRE